MDSVNQPSRPSNSERKTARWLPAYLIGFGLAWTIAMSVMSMTQARNVKLLIDTIVGRDLQNIRLVGQIVHYDEVLTMSAHLAAATGHERWIDRYWEYEPKLGQAIETSMLLAPGAYGASGAAATNAANDALVDMESRSFQLVRDGKADVALQLLESPEYHRQKDIYSAGMEASLRAIEASATRNETAVGFQISRARFATLASLFLLTGGWVIVLVLVIRVIVKQGRVERRLEETTADAEANAKARSEFLANMSHEIRTPLNGVVGMIDLLSTTPLSSEQAQFANTARSSGQALQRVIDDILDFSKIDADQLALESIPFDLRECLENIGVLLAPRASAKGVDLLVDVARGMTTQRLGDPTRITQIAFNLVGNALKFTESGSVKVVVRNPGDSDRLQIDVVDTGIGIPSDRIGKLFHSFQQADSSTSRRFGGTGLGLVISQRLAELMKGAIHVSSVEGEGSTFSVLLELPRVENAPDLETAERALDSEALSGCRALVVDPFEASREQLVLRLSSWGCETLEADSAEAAATLLRDAAPVTFLIVDRNLAADLPIDATSQTPTTNKTHLVLIGARPQDVADHTQPAAASLLKPVRRRELLTTLVRLRQGRPDEATVASNDDANDLLVALRQASPRVLVVDDNIVNRKVVAAMLKRAKLTFESAADGMEALAEAERGDYDIILMDCQMPEIDGYEATRRLRRWETSTHARRHVVIALTAHALAGDRERCLDAGMDDYLTKPIQSARLYRILLEHVPATESKTSPRS